MPEGYNLTKLNLPDNLSSKARALNIPTHKVIIEITESRMVENLALVQEITARLRLRGFVLSIDDFGTGYSSLEQLNNIPFSELKIDRCFVDKACNNADSKAIFESSVELANKMGLSTVAEGVETEQDLLMAKMLGCDIAQGYLFSKPMPLEETLAFIESFSSDWPDHKVQ